MLAIIADMFHQEFTTSLFHDVALKGRKNCQKRELINMLHWAKTSPEHPEEAMARFHEYLGCSEEEVQAMDDRYLEIIMAGGAGKPS